jgi:hypothetical protein
MDKDLKALKDMISSLENDLSTVEEMQVYYYCEKNKTKAEELLISCIFLSNQINELKEIVRVAEELAN